MAIGNRGLMGQPTLPYIDFHAYANSDVYLDMTFLDHTGTPAIPTSIIYRVDDITNAQPMIPNTILTPNGTSEQTVNIPGASLQMSYQWEGSQLCQVAVQAIVPDSQTGQPSTINAVYVIELCSVQTPGNQPDVTSNGFVAADATLTPAGGSATSVVLSSAAPGATIRYTMDGTTPDYESAVYTVPLTISGTTTVQVLVTAPGYLEGTGSGTYTPPGGSVPAPAAGAGYNTKTFGDALALNGNMFPFNFLNVTPPAGGIVVNSDGSLTFTGNSGDTYNASAASARYNATAPNKFTGPCFGGGAYFEVVAKYKDLTQPGTAGFPALWGMAVEHLAMHGADAYPGKPGFKIWAELDIHEEVGVDGVHYKITVWTHVSDGTTITDYKATQTVSNGGIDPSGYNQYGALWIPATGSTQGSVAWFFNRVQVGTTYLYNQFNAAAPIPPTAGDQLFAIADLQHFPLILGSSSTTYPLTVLSASVWQTSSANNITG